MTSPKQLEILDLRHFSARQLRPLLEQEAEIWQKRLRWDYRTSTDLLLQYLDSRILPGFVALARGRICGYTFCVYEGHKAVIGDLYASVGETAPLPIALTLANHLVEVLEASPDIDRVEAQLLLFDSGILTPSFAESGFAIYPRLFLELELTQKGDDLVSPSASLPTNVFPSDLELCRWSSSFYQPTAELIHAAYVGHIDSEINDQYRSLHGSLRFLHNIVRFPGCGTFDPDSSWALRERRTGELVAILLCSRVAPEVAHVTQLCVAPRARGRRLGNLLLRFCMRRLPQQHYRALTLTVSEGNASALRLYMEAGFQVRHRFDALVLNKMSRPDRFSLKLETSGEVPTRPVVSSSANKAAKPVRK